MKLGQRFSFSLNKRLRAFTLAEVLITLGIIGVVAAISIPVLQKNIQNYQFRQAWKKDYAILAQAINEIYAEDGVGFEWTRGVSNYLLMPRYYCKLEKKLKVLKSGMICPEDPDTILTDYAQWPVAIGGYKGYWHANENWKIKNGSLLNSNTAYFPMTAILADGAMIKFTCYSEIQVDVNGFKKPNTVGEDIFYFLLANNGKNKTTFWGVANECLTGYATSITTVNYKNDCENGTGWGCSPYYILGN